MIEVSIHGRNQGTGNFIRCKSTKKLNNNTKENTMHWLNTHLAQCLNLILSSEFSLKDV